GCRSSTCGIRTSPGRTTTWWPGIWVKTGPCDLLTMKNPGCSNACSGADTMSFLSFLLGNKKTSASVAKDRLQLILINERGDGDAPDYLPALRKELIEVISKYVKIKPDDLQVNLERQDALEVLEVKIEMPDGSQAAR